jgi:hypothetical protein
VIAVEIKIKPDIEDINGRVERREKRYRYAYLHDDKRDYLGGIAGVVFSESDKEIRAQK